MRAAEDDHQPVRSLRDSNRIRGVDFVYRCNFVNDLPNTARTQNVAGRSLLHHRKQEKTTTRRIVKKNDNIAVHPQSALHFTFIEVVLVLSVFLAAIGLH